MLLLDLLVEQRVPSLVLHGSTSSPDQGSASQDMESILASKSIKPECYFVFDRHNLCPPQDAPPPWQT